MPRFIAAALLALAAAAPLRVLDLDNRLVDPFEATAGAKAVVFLFTATDCPISNRYAPEVRRLVKTFEPKGVRFRLVYANPADQPDAVREHVKSFEYPSSVEALRDPTHAFVKFSGATITPEAVVVVDGRVVYHGRIDDRFVDFGVDRPEPTVRDLADALTAVIAGKPVPHPVTQAVGCYIADYKR
jgi:thiol-disulfide isomerase/thioredoxin